MFLKWNEVQMPNYSYFGAHGKSAKNREDVLAPSPSILKSNQIKSNVDFWREGKTGVSREAPLVAE